jgi:hypothetical protein
MGGSHLNSPPERSVKNNAKPHPLSELLLKYGTLRAAFQACRGNGGAGISTPGSAELQAVGNTLPWVVGMTQEEHGKWLHVERSNGHAARDIHVLTHATKGDMERILGAQDVPMPSADTEVL